MEVVLHIPFLVMTADTNHLHPLIYGGRFMAKIDSACALASRELLEVHGRKDKKLQPVTFGSGFQFHMPSYSGDVLDIIPTANPGKNTSLRVDYEVKRKYREEGRIASGHMLFVTVDEEELRKKLSDRPRFLPYIPHGIKVDDE